MYRTGHLGVALLLFAPVAHLLVRAGSPALAFLVGVTVCWFAMLPDVDHRLPGISHRGSTHTLLFAALVGTVAAGLGVLLIDLGAGDALVAVGVPTGRVAAFGFLLGAATVGAHLVGDWLTPAGVAPFWPLSGRRYSLGLAPAASPVANYGLFVLGVFATAVGVVSAVGV